MFLKIVGSFQKLDSAKFVSVYTLSASSSVDQIYQYYPGKIPLEIREELIEMNEEDTLELSFTNGEVELGHLSIPSSQIGATENWRIENDAIESGFSLSIDISVAERVPKNWFDAGIDLLSAPRPWYFKGEDLYSLIKHVLEQYKISTSTPVIEICRAVDFASMTVARNLLSVRLDEGFSIVAQLDDLLESVLSASDKFVDSKLIQLARSIQQLRKVVTRRLHEISFFTQEKLYLLRTQAETASQGYGTLDSTYVWALEKTEETKNRVKNDILDRIRSLRDAGRSAIAAVQSQIYNRLVDNVTGAQRSLFDIPVLAHPYILGAVGATQPYVQGALATAAPLIQTIREKTPVDNWINETKDALEKNATVGPLVVAATQVLVEVKSYCTDEQYFDHTQQETQQAEAESKESVENSVQ